MKNQLILIYLLLIFFFWGGCIFQIKISELMVLLLQYIITFARKNHTLKVFFFVLVRFIRKKGLDKLLERQCASKNFPFAYGFSLFSCGPFNVAHLNQTFKPWDRGRTQLLRSAWLGWMSVASGAGQPCSLQTEQLLMNSEITLTIFLDRIGN